MTHFVCGTILSCLSSPQSQGTSDSQIPARGTEIRYGICIRMTSSVKPCVNMFVEDKG